MVIQNVGPWDARIRALVGVLPLVVSVAFNHRPLLALGAGFLGLVLIGTALFRICPLYTMLSVDTNRRAAPQ